MFVMVGAPPLRSSRAGAVDGTEPALVTRGWTRGKAPVSVRGAGGGVTRNPAVGARVVGGF
ncbi:MAG: hypothetical protein JWN02_2398, partial [Acidobacteria bacterium]|nr:hypothetical protein [Acidobacteriota bacterium]